MSWDLGIQMKRRKQKDSANGSRRRARWEVLTGWGDDAIDEETDDDDRPTSDGDILGDVTNSISKRKREAILGADIPYERRWEIDPLAFEPGTVSTIHAKYLYGFLLHSGHSFQAKRASSWRLGK
jgi:WD repeat-containing protein 48